MFLDKEYNYKGHTIRKYWYRDIGTAYNSSYGRFRKHNRMVTFYSIGHVDEQFDTLRAAKHHIDNPQPTKENNHGQISSRHT